MTSQGTIDLRISGNEGTEKKIEELPPRPEEEIASDVETSPTDLDFDSMSKLELESYGRTLGVELDRRQSKDKLINQLKDIT